MRKPMPPSRSASPPANRSTRRNCASRSESARREREQVIDILNADTVTRSEFAEQAQANAQRNVQAFEDFLQTHRDELAALSFFYAQPTSAAP